MSIKNETNKTCNWMPFLFPTGTWRFVTPAIYHRSIKYMVGFTKISKISRENYFLQGVLEMSWRRFCERSWRRLEDAFWRRIWKTSSRCLQDVFIETNVWWEMLFFNRYLNLFHLSVAFHKENQSTDLPCISNDCFFINCNSGLKWVERALHQWNISPTLLVKD